MASWRDFAIERQDYHSSGYKQCLHQMRLSNCNGHPLPFHSLYKNQHGIGVATVITASKHKELVILVRDLKKVSSMQGERVWFLHPSLSRRRLRVSVNNVVIIHFFCNTSSFVSELQQTDS